MLEFLTKNNRWAYWIGGCFTLVFLIVFESRLCANLATGHAKEEWLLYKDNYSCTLNTFDEVMEKWRPEPECACKSASGVELEYLQPKNGECKKQG